MNKNIAMIVLVFAIILASGCTEDEDEYDPDYGYIITDYKSYAPDKTFTPQNWTNDLREVYNESEAINILEYDELNHVTLNNETRMINKIIIVVIPDNMENRGLFGTKVENVITRDKHVIVGNDTVVTETRIQYVYVFLNKPLAKELYDLENLWYDIYNVDFDCINVTNSSYRS